MNQDTLLLRQVHPSWIQSGHVTSQLFKPTPKDHKRLSVYDGDLIAPQKSWEHFSETLGFKSVGVMAVNVEECGEWELSARSDPGPFPEHAIIDFSAIPENEIKTITKYLKRAAEDRGWLYRAE